MAFLSDKDGNLTYLSSLHTIGRLPTSVDTFIPRPEVSRYHAAIEWSNEAWHIRDLSLNGTWLNHNRLKKDHQYPLSKGDKLQFGHPQSDTFVIQNIQSPMDVLFPECTEKKPEKNIIFLNSYHLLPNEQSPEIAIFKKQSQWYIEELNSNSSASRSLQNKERVKFSGQQWQLRLASEDEPTVELGYTPNSLDDLSLTFYLSQDEESTKLTIDTHDGQHNLRSLTHHYMTLNLARIRAQDANNGIDLNEQGWVYTEQLANLLGLDENHLNIQIHRARKQFYDTFGETQDPAEFIQRRSGKVRLGCTFFKIFKGSTLECALDALNKQMNVEHS